MVLLQGTKKPTESSGWSYRFRLAGALVLPVFFETLDYTVVATAQTSIASNFGRLDLQSYIGTAYVLTSTVFLPLFGSFADIFGRHWAMQLSLLFFIVGSAISTGSNDMITMLAGRGVAGVGAAGLLTVVRVILADSTSLDDNNSQAAMLSILYGIGYSVGPILGGTLIAISYRWVFGINLPFGVVSMVLIFFLLRNRVKGPQPRRTKGGTDPVNDTIIQKFLQIDFVGATLFIAGGILFLLALNWGSTANWSETRVIVCFILGGLLLLGFIGWEYIIEPGVDQFTKIHPYAPKWTQGMDTMIPLGVFSNYDVSATCFATMASGMVMLGIFYFVAIFFVIVQQNSAARTGIQLLFFAPGLGVGVGISILMIKILRQPKYPIVLSSVTTAVSLGLIAMAMEIRNPWLVNVFMALCGIGVGLGFAPLAIHARFSQPEERIAVVTALNLFFRSVGGTIGLAQLSAVMNSLVRSYITSLITAGTITFSDAALLSGRMDSLESINALPESLSGYVKEAFRYGLRWAFISLVPWCAVAVVLVLFLSKIRDTDKKPEGSDQENPTTTGVETEQQTPATTGGEVGQVPSTVRGEEPITETQDTEFVVPSGNR